MALTKSMTAFSGGAPTVQDAKALATEDVAALLELVDALSGSKQRGHLEILSQGGLPKAAKKAARKAAHKLRCAGISSDFVPVRTGGFDFSVETDLSQVALVSAPGLRSQGWHAFTGLKDLSPFEIVVREGGHIAEVNILQSLSMSKMKRALGDIRDSASTGLPVLADAALAVRLIDHMHEAVRQGDGKFPSEWTHVLGWRDKAIELGAQPETREARALLAKELAKVKDEPDLAQSALLDNPECGVMLPPTAVLEALFREVQVVTHSDTEFERDQFNTQLRGLAMAQLDHWLGDAQASAALADRLDAVADVLLSTDDEKGALHALWLADQLRATSRLPHEHAALAECMVRLMATDAAWDHYKAEDHSGCGQ